MKISNYTGYMFAACVCFMVAVLFTGCDLIHDDGSDCQQYTPDGKPIAYLSVMIHTANNSAVTKAGTGGTGGGEGSNTPSGGENGDGREPGEPFENAVNDLTLYIYEGELNSADNPAVITVSFTDVDFTATSNTHYITESRTVEGLYVNKTYHVLAVANSNGRLGTINTLDDLRNCEVTDINNSDSYFLMSSEKEASFDILPNNSKNNPATAAIDIERVAARVDYKAPGYAGSYNGFDYTNTGMYPVIESKGSSTTAEDLFLGAAQITDVMLVNTLAPAQSSFLLKRVTSGLDINSAFTYLGDETFSEQYTNNLIYKKATNYVLDPYIKQKTDQNKGNISPHDYYTPATYFTGLTYDNKNTWQPHFTSGASVGKEGFKRVGYLKENIAEQGSKYFTTGIVFKANFYLADNTSQVSDKLVTFFEHNGKIARTIEGAMNNWNSKAWTLIKNQEMWTSISTWNDLKDKLISQLPDNDPTGYKKFLLAQLPAPDLSVVIPNKEPLQWTNYMSSVFGYTGDESTNQFMIDQDGKDTQKLLFPYGLAVFKNGVCYYTYWIKHANDGVATNDMPWNIGGKMEYAIVRNNIYRLNVKSISHLGNDIPGDKTLTIEVSVQDWNKLTHEDVELQ